MSGEKHPMRDVCVELLLYILAEKARWAPCFEILCAQMALESGHGKSDLAVGYNNFGGMKYRPWMAEVGATPSDYTDWDNDREAYAHLPGPEAYPPLKFKLMGKNRYRRTWKKHKEPGEFIRTLALCGYVWTLPGFPKKRDDETTLAYRTRVAAEYLKRIMKIQGSGDFQRLMDDVYQSATKRIEEGGGHV